MKEYLVCVVLISALASLCSHFFGEAGSARFGRLAVGTVLLYAVLSPLASLSVSLPELPSITPPAEGEETPLYEARAQAAFCEGIRETLCERFGISEECISVRSEGFSVTEMRAERVCVLLSGKGIFLNSLAVAAFVEEAGLGECEVEIEIGGS